MVHVDFYIVKFRSTFSVRTFSVYDFGVHFRCTFSSKYIFGEYIFGKVRFRWQPCSHCLLINNCVVSRLEAYIRLTVILSVTTVTYKKLLQVVQLYYLIRSC